jgi:ribosomal protein S18 acetylase RimI-like enzyme
MGHGVALRSRGNEAVSLWRRPGRINPGQAELQAQLPHLAQAFRRGGARSRLMGETLKPYQPEGDDWWYLQFIGAHPDVHGQGFGGAAVRAGLDLARAAGQRVHVEVMNPENLGYYRHVGFETVAEFDIPDAGPHVWAMIAHP